MPSDSSGPPFSHLWGKCYAGPTQLPATSEQARVRRTNNTSPTFAVTDDDVDFFMNYSWWEADADDPANGERKTHDTIMEKVGEMLRAARTHIVVSVFLFDSFYAEVEADIVSTIVNICLEKRKKYPEMTIAFILDPSQKAYGRRLSPAEKTLRENGIDVFYSDLISNLKKASLFGVREAVAHVSRLIDRITFNGWGNMWSFLGRPRTPVKFDGDLLSIESIFNAFLLKANHRKILVTDTDGDGYELLVTSANPHNSSAYHVNSAVSVKGEIGRYVLNVLRRDMKYSAGLGGRFAHWHYDADKAYRKNYFERQMTIHDVPIPEQEAEDGIRATFVSEGQIVKPIVRMLRTVEPGDEVRIQMFYLSYKPVLKAILVAMSIVETPVRLILDANKDSFNMIKDGTPNRQVARYFLKKAAEDGGKVEIRWYSTHGEQNHAKTMSITNAESGKFQLTTGSCNWTGRNMAGVNMEANIILEGSARVNAEFNDLFDLFWTNEEGKEYTLPYEEFQEAASNWKWKRGERPFYYSSF